VTVRCERTLVGQLAAAPGRMVFNNNNNNNNTKKASVGWLAAASGWMVNNKKMYPGITARDVHPLSLA